ncbi:MAG: RNB domain-containing ribonuclease, partial [Pseudomonadota bacterium]
MSKRSKTTPRPLPTRKDILDFISSADGAPTRRDIARAFDVKGDDRAALRTLLKEMADDGALAASGRRRFAKADDLPPVAPVDVMSVDDDGDLLCMPAGWESAGDPPLIRLSRRRAEKRKPTPGVGDRLLARLKPAGDGGYEADIIKAIGKSAHRFLAVYRKQKGGAIAEPVERRARNVFAIDGGDDGGAKDGDLVWVETKNARGYGPRKARVRKIEGHVDDRDAFSLIAVANHGIPIEFPEDVLQAAKKARLPDARGREDLRTIDLLTIDPADARDHDDAVWATRVDDGFKVIVAIADVSYFVRPGTALDREARRRGNSTYLPDRVVPMLPERLSNDLCSLREHEDRPCLAVEMTLDANGVKRSHRFLRGIMRSAGKLAYEDAQAIIDGGDAPGALAQTVRTLHDAFKARLKERKKRAPLDLELPERRVVLGDDGRVAAVELRERFDAHRLIEEFMILANVCAAETLETKRTPLLYRVHEEPNPDKLDALREVAEA